MTVLINTWRINAEESLLEDISSGTVHKIEPKTMAVLLLLIEKHDQVVSREDFMQGVWNGTFTVEESLTRCISELRKIFNDSPRTPRYIKTVHKKGYQLLVTPVIEECSPDVEHVVEAEKVDQARTHFSFTIGASLTVLFVVIIGVYLSFTGKLGSSVDNTAVTFHSPTFKASNFDDFQRYFNSAELSSANIANIMWRSADQKSQYEIVTSVSNTGTDNAQRIIITVYDEAANQVWEAERDFNIASEKTAVAQDLIRVLELLQSSKEAPELATLPKEMRDQYKQAMYYMDKRGKDNLLKAIDVFEAILNERADFAIALVQQAVAVRSLGFYETDIETREQLMIRYELLLKQAKSVAPEHPVVRSMTAVFDPNKPDWLNHEKILTQAVRYAPACAICVRTLAEFYLNLGYFQKAEDLTVSHMDYFPLSLFMHSFLGQIYSKQGKIEETRYQADVIDALGGGKGFDTLTIRIQVAMMEGNVEMNRQLSAALLEKHPAVAQHLQVREAIKNNNLDAAREIIHSMPRLDFNLAIDAAMFDELIDRINRNLSKGQIRDLSLIHGWLMPDTYISPQYLNNLILLKNQPEISQIFEAIELFSFWEQNEQWPDYCRFDKYEAHRPAFCP